MIINSDQNKQTISMNIAVNSKIHQVPLNGTTFGPRFAMYNRQLN